MTTSDFGGGIIVGDGINLENSVPASTTNTLYNDAGTLKFNGSAVGSSYTTGSGLTLVGTEFNTAGSGQFSHLSFDGGNGFNSVKIGKDAGKTIETNEGQYGSNVFIGENAGSGIHLNGGFALAQITAIGLDSLKNAAEPSNTTSIGANTLENASNTNGTVAIGGYALHGAKNCNNNTAIGYFAMYNHGSDSSTATGFRNQYNVAVGRASLSDTNGIEPSIGVTAIGSHSANRVKTYDYGVAVGYYAGWAASGVNNIAVGYQSLKSATGTNNIEVVTQGASSSIVGTNDNKLHIENTIIGDTSSKLLAIGNVTSSDLTPDATLEIKPNAATDVGLIVQAATSHSASLQEWQNSSENVLSHVDSTGIYTNIVGSTGTDILRVKYGDERNGFDGASPTEVTGVWLDFEDGTEYTAGTVNAQSLVLGTWYNNTKTIPSRIKISATAFNVSLANSQKFDIQATTAKFNTDVLPFTTMARDLGSESLVWRNVYASGLSASGVELLNHVPATTTNKLYNDGGTLTFNGSAVGGGSSLTAGSGITIDGADQINVHGGSGHFINLDVEGAFTATTKSFLIDHPSKEGKKLQYASLEGPENGVYVRGTTKDTFITLPDYWRDLVHNNSITVSLTSVGSFQPLFVESKSNREIIVGGVCGYYDYVVYGERKDVAKLEVEW